jgi:hypothetical protein
VYLGALVMFRLRQREIRQLPVHFDRFGREPMDRSRRFLDHGGILLRHRIKL